jgi:hypothetical protein
MWEVFNIVEYKNNVKKEPAKREENKKTGYGDKKLDLPNKPAT